MTGFAVIITPANLFYCLLGSVIGTLIGVLPGIGPLAALALLMPVTFTLSPVSSMAMLASMFYGAMYGGSTTSILVNIPGEAASVVTCIDGHQMAKKGRAGAALGMAAIGSFIAGTLSLIALTFFSPILTQFAISFGPPEYFALMVLGLVCALLMTEGSALKGLAMLALGFVLASVGMDPVSGIERFAFGSIDMAGGFELVAIVIGLFGLSEILLNVETTLRNEVVDRKIGAILPTRQDYADCWRAILRGSGLGFVLGVLPGGGPVTAVVPVVRARAADLADARALRRGRDRGRGRARVGEQRGGREQHDPAAVARPAEQRGHRAADGRAGDPGRAARAGADDAAPGRVLGRDRQHVRRQRVPAGAEPAADRVVGAAAADPVLGAVPDDPAARDRRHLLGEQELLRPVGDDRVRRGRLPAAQGRLRARPDGAHHRPRADDGAVAAPVDGDVPPTAPRSSPPGRSRSCSSRSRSCWSSSSSNATSGPRRPSMSLRRFAALLSVALVAALPVLPAHAQSEAEIKAQIAKLKPKDFPNQPIEVTVVYPAGGGMDINARLIAKYFEKYTGEKAIVNNRTGGTGMIGHTWLATQAPKDGHAVGVIANLVFGDAFLRAQGKWSLDDLDPMVYLNNEGTNFVVATDGRTRTGR